jgi:hypothetical protein
LAGQHQQLALAAPAATTTQSFQLPFKLLQLCDPRANVRDVLIKQPMRRFAIFCGRSCTRSNC